MQSLEELLQYLPKCHVLDPNFKAKDYVALDLSSDNELLKAVDVSSSEVLETYISEYIKIQNSKIAYGGYLEQRNIYNRSNYFNTTNPETERNIHLGIDLWISSGTPIFAPLDAKIHSFKNNTNFGDYGPTVILEHQLDNIVFYTLYGHLSLESIEEISVGQQLTRGQQFASLGDASVNGDYPPHLHFQIIKDLQGNVGDYPGVCSKQDLEYYNCNCPDPNLLLNIR